MNTNSVKTNQKSIKLQLVIIFLLSVILLSIKPSIAAEPASENFIKFYIIHTNDTHGNFQKTWKKGHSDSSAIERLKNNIIQKNGNDNILLLDAGDIMANEKDDSETMLYDLAEMSRLKYDAIALGNHDVKLGLENLKDASDKFNLPILCSNLVYKQTKEYVFKPYIVKNIGGVKIGILGFTTPEVLEKMKKEDASEVSYLTNEEAYSKIIDQFKSDCDFRIALTHIGEKDDAALLSKHKKITVAIGGHSPDQFKEPKFIGSSCFVNTGKYGINIGQLKIKLDPEFLEVKSIEGSLIKIGDDSEL